MKNLINLTRINKPTGIWLLFVPCLLGLALSLKYIQEVEATYVLKLIFLFFLGSIFMRSAGCIINDLLDEKIDKQVLRTKDRPIASGKVSRVSAIVFLLVLLSLSFLILIQFNGLVILAAMSSVLLVVAYPLMKRLTYYPQLFLGVTFNFGIILASLEIIGQITLPVWILYFMAIVWTVIYDTIYAFQDINDDLKVGNKSFAIKIMNNPKKILFWLTFVMFVCLFLIGIFLRFRAEFFITIFLADLYLNLLIIKCDLKNTQDCYKVFKNNVRVGLLILLALVLG